MPNPAVVIYVNQLNAKARRYAQSYQQFFARRGESIVVIESSVNRDADHQGLLAALADAQECVVIGGDGSVNIAVNALIASHRTHIVSLSVVGVGTGNDFARDHDLHDWRWRMQGQPKSHWEAVGCVYIHDQTRYFVNHVGTGLSVDVMGLQPKWLKYQFGGLSYFIALLRYLFSPQDQRRYIQRCGRPDLGQFVALGRYIGGGFKVFPSADRKRAQFCGIYIPKLSRWQQLIALARVLQGRLNKAPQVEVQYGETMTIGAAEQPLELDGDIYFCGPAQVAVIHAAIQVNQVN